jgi:hypothetical protein
MFSVRSVSTRSATSHGAFGGVISMMLGLGDPVTPADALRAMSQERRRSCQSLSIARAAFHPIGGIGHAEHQVIPSSVASALAPDSACGAGEIPP